MKRRNSSLKERLVEVNPGKFISVVPLLSQPRLIIDMRLTPHRPFPTFVKYLRSELDKENLTICFLDICGKEYRYHPVDLWIDPAIFLAARWKPGEQTFERIQALRDWLRENDQHAHHLEFEHLMGLEECKAFILSLAKLEYPENIVGKDQYNLIEVEITTLFSNDPER